jgi:outer membrane protein
LTFSPFSLSLEQCLEDAYGKRPDLAMARKAVEVAQKDVTIAYSGLYPQVGADFDWYHSGSKPYVQGSGLSRTEYSYWQGEVSASWNVFDWGETRSAGRQAEETVRQLVADESDSRLEAGYEVKSRHLKIAEAAERISVARKSLESAREGYRMAVARYQAQVGTNTDVLDAQARLTRAEAGLTEAMADYQIALSRLYVSIGQKNPALATQ